MPDLFIPCGAVYIYHRRYLARPDGSVPAAWIEATWPESLDVDEPEDLVMAESLLECGRVSDRAGGPGDRTERDA